MTDDLIRGRAFHCGDHVSTDVISPGRFEPYAGPADLARVALIDYDAPVPFVNPTTGRSEYVVIFAGRDFGCGSSRETAPQALRYAGARAIIARSFARIFYRNCINMGLLLPIVYPHHYHEDVIGRPVELDLGRRRLRMGPDVLEFPDFGPLTAIVEAGGLLEFTKRRMTAVAR